MDCSLWKDIGDKSRMELLFRMFKNSLQDTLLKPEDVFAGERFVQCGRG